MEGFINRISNLAILGCIGILSACSEKEEQQQNQQNQEVGFEYIMDAVHHNPGEPYTESKFNDPAYLADLGYKAQVINDFTFIHTAIFFDSLDKEVFEEGSAERAWVTETAKKVDNYITKAHEAGLDIYFWTDVIVLPKKVVEIYGEEILDEEGKIDLHRPKTQEIHRLMFREILARFPAVDGFVIRTGETYLNNVPYHIGNNPITRKQSSHIVLINLLREEFAEKGKKVFYRTWSFDGFHTKPEYYLSVTDSIQPHDNLIFSIKHPEGDFHRNHPFNPTLGKGKHSQIVEVQCQREYEGKGAHPNYIANGVINGFEENKKDEGIISLKQLKENSNFKGVWTWSRGGGWKGPYIENEVLCEQNAFVMSKWAGNPQKSEEEVFYEFCDYLGLNKTDATNFRKISLSSAEGVVRGRSSLIFPVNRWWIRDEFMGGLIDDGPMDNVSGFGGFGKLDQTIHHILEQDLIAEALAEKEEAVRIWQNIDSLASTFTSGSEAFRSYLDVSATYGYLKYAVIHQGWKVMLYGLKGDLSGAYDKEMIAAAIKEYDRLWIEWKQLKADNADCATLYKPNAFVYIAPDYYEEGGMAQTINKYRKLKASAVALETRE